MRLFENAYEIGQATGNVVVKGNEILFFNGKGGILSSACNVPLPGGIGRYSWTLTGASVHFVSLAPDPCGRAEVLAGVTWTRTRP